MIIESRLPQRPRVSTFSAAICCPNASASVLRNSPHRDSGRVHILLCFLFFKKAHILPLLVPLVNLPLAKIPHDSKVLVEPNLRSGHGSGSRPVTISEPVQVSVLPIWAKPNQKPNGGIHMQIAHLGLRHSVQRSRYYDNFTIPATSSGSWALNFRAAT